MSIEIMYRAAMIVLASILSSIWIRKSERIKSDEGELYAFPTHWRLFGAGVGFLIALHLIHSTTNNVHVVLLTAIASLLATQFVIDLKYQELANEWNVLLGVFSISYLIVKQPENTKSHLIAWIALTLLFSFWWAFSNGLGFGDVKLIFATGFLLQTHQVIPYLTSTLLLATMYGLGVMFVTKKGLKTEFAFGPFLIIGMLIVGIT